MRTIPQDLLSRVIAEIKLGRFASVEDLTSKLGVSASTIRRYLIRLEKEQQIRRIHGGAVPSEPQTNAANPVQVSMRLQQGEKEKRIIALQAVSLVKPNDTLFLDAGSSCYYVAELLPENQGLTVITHAQSNLLALRGKTGIKLVALGVEFDAVLDAFVGPVTEAALEMFRAAKAFLGVSRLDPHRGSFDNTVVEKGIKRMMNRQACESYLLADGSKFSGSALFLSLDISEIKAIIVDASAPSAALQQLREKGVQVLQVKSQPVPT